MAFLRSSSSSDNEPDLAGAGLRLRPPAMSDYVAWAELRAKSREHLQPFEPQWARDELTRSAFRRRLKHYQREAREDQGHALLIFASADAGLLGGLTLSNIRRGVSQMASLGYWIGAPHAGHGLMTEAVRAVLPFAFETLRLHRLEAACVGGNAASIRVLEKAGFRREGVARRYLKINGIWQDHILFALLEDDTRREVERR